MVPRSPPPGRRGLGEEQRGRVANGSFLQAFFGLRLPRAARAARVHGDDGSRRQPARGLPRRRARSPPRSGRRSRRSSASARRSSSTTPARGEMRIFTPAVELPFAGHPTVGTAWLLARERARGRRAASAGRRGAGAARRRPRRSSPPARTGRRPSTWEQLAAPARSTPSTARPAATTAVGYWAWIDEDAGLIRARVFPLRYGIAEDEATGAAAIRLCARLGRAIEIHQGRALRAARPARLPAARGRARRAGGAGGGQAVLSDPTSVAAHR